MEPGDIINSAFKPELGVLLSERLYVVEANSEQDTMRILSLKEAYEYGYICFKYGIESGNTILGVFNTMEAADEFILFIRSMVRDESGASL